MSIKALNWAIEQPTGSPHEKLVLLVLAHHHNEKRGGQCDPALATIAAKSGLSMNGARAALARLEASALIRIIARTVRGRDISKQYHLAISEPNERRNSGAPGEPQNASGGARPAKGSAGESMDAPGEPNREVIGKNTSQEKAWGETGAERDRRAALRVVGDREWNW
jgi:Helix-turn-helix domain